MYIDICVVVLLGALKGYNLGPILPKFGMNAGFYKKISYDIK